MTKRLYSIVIPVYNSNQTLIKIAARIKKVFNSKVHADYELLFVNDSPFIPQTREILEDIQKNDTKVIIIELTKNYGQQAATLCGIEAAQGDYIITMDDDLQHDPEAIPKLIQQQHHDIVIAKLTQNKHTYAKRLTSKVKSYFDYIILNKPFHIQLSSFRLINSHIANMMLKTKSPYPFIPALLLSVSDDIVNVNVLHHYRDEGQSNYCFFKRFKLFSNLIINNSSLLLRIIGYLGIIISLLSFSSGIYLIIKKIFFYYAIEGWTSLMVAILFFGGMILFTLGVIGEYLVRIISTSEQRPIYSVRKIIKDNK